MDILFSRRLERLHPESASLYFTCRVKKTFATHCVFSLFAVHYHGVFSTVLFLPFFGSWPPNENVNLGSSGSLMLPNFLEYGDQSL